MKRLHLNLTALVALAITAGGCLQRDITETWYVDGNGAVTWVVSEQNVRSDSKAVLDRRTEESEYWLAVQQDFAFVGRKHARQDIHQRGFAGAIFA